MSKRTSTIVRIGQLKGSKLKIKAVKNDGLQVKVFGKPDREYLEGSRSGSVSGRSQPPARVQQSVLLQVESQIWRDEHQ